MGFFALFFMVFFAPLHWGNRCFLLYLVVHVILAGSVYYTLGVDCIHLEYGVPSFSDLVKVYMNL